MFFWGIENFRIGGHYFVQLFPDPAVEDPVEAGFYELISTGPATLFRRWNKQYEPANQNSPGKFTEIRTLYLLVRNRYHKIHRRPSLIRALEDREKEIKSYIRTHVIIIGSGDLSQIKQVVDHYNSLQP